MTALLDNKARFSNYAASLGLAVPQHLVVSSLAQLTAINNDAKVHESMLPCRPPVQGFKPDDMAVWHPLAKGMMLLIY
jgi:hypothetical protein